MSDKSADNSKHWNTAWIAFGVLVIAVFIGTLIYMYTQGKKGNEKYASFYHFVHHPSWQSFREWFADTANDPWTDIVLTLTFAMIPLPFLPEYAHNRLEVFLSKIGLYYILVTLILGRPNYTAKKDRPWTDYVGGVGLLGLLLVIYVGSKLYWRGKAGTSA